MEDSKLKVEKFSKNSMVFLEGNRDIDRFYIIREGKVKTSRLHEISDDPKGNILASGDVFGIISAMSRRQRIETVTALTDISVIVINQNQFVSLIQKNTPVALKIIRLFSKKLRNFDADIARLTLKKPLNEDVMMVEKIGDYYYSKNMYSQAFSAYSGFMKYCQDGNKRAEIINKLTEIKDKKPELSEYEEINQYTRKYYNGTLLFCEHEPGLELFIVQDGQVQITKIAGEKEILLAVLNPGDIIGEMAILENKPRSASAVAYGDVTVTVINKDNFAMMVQTKPQMILKIIKLLSERIWVAYRQLENVLIPDSYERILDAMLTQVEKNKIDIEPRKSYNFGFGPNELINMLGLSDIEGNENIRKLLQDKNYQLVDGKLAVQNLEELEKQVDVIRKKQDKLANANQ